MATPTFRAVGAAKQVAAASVTLVAPSSTMPGDLLLAFIGSRNASSTGPSGWATVAAQSLSGGYAGALTVFSKTAVSGDAGASFVFSTSTSSGVGQLSGAIGSYSSANRVDKYAGTTPAAGASAAAPSVTTGYVNELVVEVWQANDGAIVSLTVPASSRLAQSNSASNQFPMLGVADQAQASAGASPVQTASGGTGTTGWAALTLALNGNQPPNAPTLNSPTGNMTIDRTSTQRFAWTFSDPDPGDSQSAFDLQYTTQNGSYPSTPQYSATTPNNYLDIPGGTFAAGSYQWQVRTYDSQGVVGPWSSAGFFAASTPPAGPTITYPTNGGTVNSPDHIDWSYTSEQSYQVQRCADNAGAIDPTTVYYDTGEVQDPNNTIRTQQLTFPTNNRYEWLRLRIKQGNQWSAWVSERVAVSYTPPPVATLAVTVGQPNAAAMLLAITNPPPTGSNPPPPATSNVIEASRDGGTTVEWSRGAVNTVNPNAVVPFWTPLSAATYSFRVTARADNGTTSTSPWTTGGDTAVDNADGTFTATGPTDNSDGTYTSTTSTDNGDGTFTMQGAAA